MNAWIYTYTPLYIFIAWWLVRRANMLLSYVYILHLLVSNMEKHMLMSLLHWCMLCAVLWNLMLRTFGTQYENVPYFNWIWLLHGIVILNLLETNCKFTSLSVKTIRCWHLCFWSFSFRLTCVEKLPKGNAFCLQKVANFWGTFINCCEWVSEWEPQMQAIQQGPVIMPDLLCMSVQY
jgi:hypothetical protein